MKENWEIHWKDYYTILQVQPLAETEVIAKAYTTLASKYHPDHNEDPTANSRMKDLNEAFEIISNPIKRREYDTAYRLKVNQEQTTAPSPIYKTKTQYTSERRTSTRRKHTMTADELANLMKQKQKTRSETNKTRGVDYMACKFYQSGKCIHPNTKQETHNCLGKDKCNVWETKLFHKVCYVIFLIIATFIFAIPWYMYITTSSLKTLLLIIALISSVPLTIFTAMLIYLLCHTHALKLKRKEKVRNE